MTSHGWRLERTYFSGAGLAESRLEGLDIVWSAPEADSGHSALWADNATGKSMITALRFALYLPHSRDFVRGGSDRSLAKLVRSGDVCHVVEQATRVVRDEQQRLVVGMVASWPDGGAQDLDNPSRLVRMFYGWLCGADGPTIDQLPFRTSVGRWATDRQFVSCLRELLPHGGAAPPFAPSDHQRHWQEWLAGSGVDLDQLRLQTVMNASEGGVDNVMRFNDSDAFVQWLIGATMPISTVDQITASIDTLRSNAASRPHWEAELGLWDQIIDPLLNLAIAHDKVAEDRRAVAGGHAAAATIVADADSTTTALTAKRDTARERFDESDQRRRDAGTVLRRAQAHRLRMQLRAAQLRAEDAEQRAARRHDTYKDALLQVDAWQRVEHVLSACDATRTISALEEQIAAAEKESDELRRDEAALRYALARLLTDRRDTAVRELDATREQLAQFRAALTKTAGEIERCIANRAAADERVKALIEQINATASTIAEAIADGLIPEGADPAAVAAELRSRQQQANSDRKRIDIELIGIDREVKERRSDLTAAEYRAEIAQQDITHSTYELRTVQTRIEALAGDERTLQVAGTGVDLWAQRSDLIDRFQQRAEQADADANQASAAASAAQRVLDSVGEDGLLPPSRIAEECARRCRTAEIPTWPGWRWLADTMNAAAAQQFATARPDIASGVVVSDPQAVNRAVDAIGELDLDAALWVGAVIDPRAAAQGTGRVEGTQARILLPHPGIFDRAAVSNMVHDAAEALAAAQRDRSAAASRAHAARAMLADLAQFWKDNPEDPRQSLAEKLDSAKGRNSAADTAIETYEGEIARLEQAQESHREARAQAQEIIDAANERLLLLVPVTTAVTARTAARDGLPTWQETVRTRAQRLTELRPEHERLTGAVRADEERSKGYEKERDDAAEALRAAGLTAAVDGLVPTEERSVLEGRLSGVRTAIESAAVDPELHTALGKERQRLSEADSRQGSDPSLRALAQKLAETDGARHSVALAASIRSAEENKEAARTDHATGKAVADAARNDYERRANDTADRSSPDVDDVPPAASVTSTPDADAFVNRLDALAAERLEAQRHHELRAHDADQAARAADHALQLLDATVTPLRHLANPDAAGRPANDPADLMRRIASVAERVRATEGALQQSRDEQRRTSDRVRNHANSALARGVEDRGDPHVVDFIRRLRGDEQLPADAERIATHVEQRGASLRDDLAHHDEDVRTCATMLHVQAERAIQRLRSYQNQSRLPSGLGEWSDNQFVTISHAPLPDDESVAVDRVARVVHAQLTPSAGHSDAQTMLFAAARALVDGPFSVRLLKPHIDLAVQRVDVAELKNFSGGQRVTAGVLLYATMTRVRAAGNDAASIGWLWLDNPFGQASADQFVRTMRMAADRLGLQLVFTAAPQDRGALSMFDRVITLNLRSRPSSGEKVIVVEDTEREVVDLALIQRDVMAVLGE